MQTAEYFGRIPGSAGDRAFRLYPFAACGGKRIPLQSLARAERRFGLWLPATFSRKI
jgi:hypothetical protein